MKVFLAVASFLPDYGGPALSVSRLGAALAAAGAEVALWAPDGSATTSPVAAAAMNHAANRPPARLSGPFKAALVSFGRPDVVHDNGIWLPYNHGLAHAAARLDVPRVVSPRGMLEPWAFRYKPTKKRLAWALYQRRDLARAALLHATAQEEADNLARFGFGVPIGVAPNGMDLPARIIRRRTAEAPRTLLFLSRVHPKKGLAMLIEAFARLRPTGWRVVVAGPDELGHTAEMAALAAAKRVGEIFAFVGPQYGAAKTQLFADADLFVLPSHSENFGMAIAEALAHEVPVVTTTAAPWPALVEHGCGWRVAPTAEAITAALVDALARSPAEHAAMGARGRAFVTHALGWHGVAAQLLALYRTVAPLH